MHMERHKLLQWKEKVEKTKQKKKIRLFQPRTLLFLHLHLRNQKTRAEGILCSQKFTESVTLAPGWKEGCIP